MTKLRTIVVVGRDADLWLSALALDRALRPAGIRTQVVELPSQLTPHDCYSAGPSLTGLHTLLGLDRKDVLAACKGVPVIGQRFSGWTEAPAFYGYDAVRSAIADIDVLQFWNKARLHGFDFAYERLSTAATAAAAGRVPVHEQDPHAFGSVHRGYHLHALAYAGALANLARSRGIEIQSATEVSVETRNGRIETLTLSDERRMEADLFVDASGADAALISQQPCDAYASWSRWLPTDRLMLTSAPPLQAVPPFADIRAVESGWAGIFPLIGRTAIVGAFYSRHSDEASFVDQLSRAVGTQQLAQPIVRPMQPGMRQPWQGNCVAIGASAVQLPPLDLMQLHFVHVGVTNLIAWLPGDTEATAQADTYNALVARYAENVRDFQLAHFWLNGRVGEPLWDAARTAEPTPALAARVALFKSRGLVPAFDEDTFDEGLWSALFVSHGLVPSDFDPRAGLVADSEVAGKMGRLLEVIADKVEAMQSVPEALRG